VQPTTSHNPLNLRAVLVSPVQVVLNWSNPANAANTYQLLRNGTAIARDTVPPADTLGMYKDSSTLVPGTMYTYILNHLVNGAPYDSDTLQVRTLDTTKDNYSWTINKIGQAGSALYSVWAASPQSVWACGFIDSSSHQQVYSLVHFQNGVPTFYGLAGVSIYNGVYGTSDSSIYIVADRVVAHYDGHQFTYHVFNGDSLPYIPPGLTSVWCTPNESDVFAVGDSGIVVHRKPDMTWEIQHAPTMLSLVAMKGFSTTEIYAVAKDPNCTGCSGNILEYNGTSWQIIATSTSSPTNDSEVPAGDFTGISGQSGDSLYTSGARIFKRNTAGWPLADAPCNTYSSSCSYYTEGVGGTWNSMWFVGDFGRVLHFNGAYWSTNYPFLNTGNNLILRNILVFPNDIYIVGGDDNSAWFIYGQ